MTQQSGRARTFPIAPGFLLAPGILITAITVWLPGCAPGPTASKNADHNNLIAVRTVAVTQAEVQQTTTQPATLHALFRSEVRAKAAGYVISINADIGDVVQAGDELARIDVPEMDKQREIIQARVKRFEAEEKSAAAGVNLADAQVRSAQARLAEAESEMNRADASLAASQSEFERTEDLVDRGSLQTRMLDEVRKKRDSERAAKQSVESSIDSAKANVAVAEAQKVAAIADQEAAAAETEIARRQLEELEVMISYATVRAPISGLVTHRSVEPGDLVGNSGESLSRKPMFVISQVDKLRVRIPVPESQAVRINPGDQVTLSFPSYPDEPSITAEVSRSAGSLDSNTRTMQVEVELDNADGKLMPGMFGQATVKATAKVAANLLPARAVRFTEDGKAYVYVVSADDTVTVTSIDTGLDDGNSIQIRGGLEPGQRVIDAHLKRFTDGQKVAILES